MVSLKLVPILALAMGLSTFAFAGDKSAKDDNTGNATATAKVEAATTPTQADAKADGDDGPFYYKVGELNEDGTYNLNPEGGETGGCPDVGTNACEIMANHSLGSTAPQTDVDGGTNGITVLHWRQL